MAIVYFNGRYRAERDSCVPIGDPALQLGVGLFEVLRGYGRTPFRLDDHLRRLRQAAKRFEIECRVSKLGTVIPKLFERNRLDGGYIRITLTGGGRLAVSVRRRQPLDPRIENRGAKLTIASWRRDRRSPLAGYKTLNYYDLALTRTEAERRGAIDALIPSLDGDILEGTRSNVFCVKKGRILTPPAAKGVLPGVTRKVVLQLAKRLRLPIKEAPLSEERLFAAEEVFITSTMMEVVPVAVVGKHRVGPPGPVTKAVRSAYRRRVQDDCGTWP